MKKQKINPATISTYETIKKIRNDWGNLNPITRRIENKKKENGVIGNHSINFILIKPHVLFDLHFLKRKCVHFLNA